MSLEESGDMQERTECQPDAREPERLAYPQGSGLWGPETGRAKTKIANLELGNNFMQKTGKFLQRRHEPGRAERHREADVEHRSRERDSRDQRCDVFVTHNSMLSKV
jgi:hypothetical protein